MHPKHTEEFAAVKRHLNKIARSEPIQASKNDVVQDIIAIAHKVPKMYDNRISIRKGQEDTKKGALTAAVAALVFAMVRTKLEPVIALDPTLESSISVLITAAVSGIFHGIQTWFWNWWKHRVYTE